MRSVKIKKSAHPLTDGLKTDLYEMTMAAGYFENRHNPEAVFELYCHTLPADRSYLVACGLAQAIEYILNLRFDDRDIDYLKNLSIFDKVSPAFFHYLKKFKFSGDLWAMPEGTICFAHEPILQVKAPIIQAQILETYLLSVINIQTLVATKAARVVTAACGEGNNRPVVDFGSRRAHGPEAGVLAARAAFIGGCLGTSNVYAGRAFGIPVFGTMAHSWVASFKSEKASFERFRHVFPKHTILLVDTYDTIKGVDAAIRLKGDIRGVRLDSGNIDKLSRKTRRLLDQNGLPHVKILASGNLNEYKIDALVRAGAPVDMFGVGTEMVTSRDHPALDLTYKLVQTRDDRGRPRYHYKTSQGKATRPGRKQVFRSFDGDGLMRGDMIGLFDEKVPKNSRRLLEPFIEKGKLIRSLPAADAIRQKAAQGLSQLPSSLRAIGTKGRYPVSTGRGISALKRRPGR